LKRALLIGVREDDPQQRLQPGPGLAAMEALLGELGGWTITRVEGDQATRAGILEALRVVELGIGPRDTFMLYYFGHAGVVEIADLPPPLGQRPVFYITTLRSRAASRLDAILDVELSLALARIDALCHDVSVILDCCHAARIVRGPGWVLTNSPEWIREVAEQTRDCEDLLAPESHSTIVRLTASSSLRWGYARRADDGHLGRLTRTFVELVREAMPAHDRLTWDSVVHRVREQVIWEMGSEDQWVTLAGPRERVLFSQRRAEPATAVAFVPHESAPGGWIRAGVLQGVKVGDEWGLAELTLDEHLRPRSRARVRVSAVELNRARVELVGEDPDEINGEQLTAPPGTSAILLGKRDRSAVLVEAPSSVRAAVEASSLLRPADADESSILAKLRHEGERLLLESLTDDFAPVSLRADRRGVAAAIEGLEDWARARTLLEIAESHPQRRSSILRVSWGLVGAGRGRGSELPLEQSEPLRVGDRVHFGVTHTGRHGDWFVSAVEIGVDGRPRLRSASEPEGYELRGGHTIALGLREHRRHDGFELCWPADIARDRPRPVTVLFLASPRPIQLGHLVRGLGPELPRFADPPRRRGDRGKLSAPRPRTGPEQIYEWGWLRIRYQLDPSGVSSSSKG
jgi:hypothetical protein